MTEPKPSSAHPARPAAVLCPYCGKVTPRAARCANCRGLLDPLSRQATQNSMGPWFVRDPANPFRPGCSYATIKDLAARGRIKPDTIIRGPTTHQFWSLAKRTPGVSQLVGLCYACQEEVEPSDEICRFCGVSFEVDLNRQHLGLAPIHLLPGQAAPEAIADATAADEVDAAAETVGKMPGSAIPAIDDSAERLLRRAAGRIRSQRILLALLSLLAFSAFALVGVIVAEHRLGQSRPVSDFLLGASGEAPAPPAEAGPGPGSPRETPASPDLQSAGPGTGAGTSARAAPAASGPEAPEMMAPASKQAPIEDSLSPIRALVEEGTEGSLESALARLADVRRERPGLATECRTLEDAARQRLAQLRLRRLP